MDYEDTLTAYNEHVAQIEEARKMMMNAPVEVFGKYYRDFNFGVAKESIVMTYMDWKMKQGNVTFEVLKEKQTITVADFLKMLLGGEWFKEVRTDECFDEEWIKYFVNALDESEFMEAIAKDWAKSGTRNKRDMIKGYIVGLLKDAGVIKGKSYDDIARKIGIMEISRTFSRHMSDGKKQPYADWVKNYVLRLNCD